MGRVCHMSVGGTFDKVVSTDFGKKKLLFFPVKNITKLRGRCAFYLALSLKQGKQRRELSERMIRRTTNSITFFFEH